MSDSRYFIKRSEIFFFLAWFLFLISVLFENTALFLAQQNFLSSMTKGLRYCAYLLCCFKIAYYSKRKKKRLSVIILFIVLCFGVSCIASTNKTMFLYLFVLIAAVGIDGSHFIRFTTWIQGIFIAFVVILSQIGILQDYVFGVGTDRIRHGLGFSWTTTGAILYFYFLLGYIYLRKEKFSIKEGILLEVINLFFFKMTDSKMAFLLSSLFIFFFLIKSKSKENQKVTDDSAQKKRLLLLIPFILFCLAVISAKFYDPSINVLSSFNNVLSNRLELGHRAIERYGFLFWGQKIKWMGFSINKPTLEAMTEYNYVDSSYLQLALQYGLVFIFIVIGIYTYGIYRAIQLNDSYLIDIYIIVLIFALIEPRLMNFAFNSFPILIFSTIINEEEEPYTENEGTIL